MSLLISNYEPFDVVITQNSFIILFYFLFFKNVQYYSRIMNTRFGLRM